MLAHKLPGQAASLRVGKVARYRERTENQIGGRCESHKPEKSHCQVKTAQLIVKSQRPRLPEEKVTSLPEQSRDRRSSGGSCDHEKREEEPGEEDERRTEKGGTASDRLVLDVERAPSPPENPGDGEITDRLDDIRTP